MQRFLDGQRSLQLLAGHQHLAVGVLAPGIQQFVGEYGIRSDRLKRLNQIRFGTGHFQRRRLLHFLRNQVRIDDRQLLQQRVTAAGGLCRSGQGGVVLFDAGLHSCSGLFLIGLDALKLLRQRHIAFSGFVY